MAISLITFGYKYGIPEGADIVLSAKKLPNPWQFVRMRNMTGLDDEVYELVVNNHKAVEFINKAMKYITYKHLIKEHSGDTLKVAIGCIGGKHRSVSIARRLHEIYTEEGIEVTLYHRDVKKR